MVIVISKVEGNNRQGKVLSERASQALIDAVNSEMEIAADALPNYEDEPEEYAGQEAYVNDLEEIDNFLRGVSNE